MHLRGNTNGLHLSISTSTSSLTHWFYRSQWVSLFRVVLIVSLLSAMSAPVNAGLSKLAKSVGKTSGADFPTVKLERILGANPNGGLIAKSEGSKFTVTTLDANGPAIATYASVDELLSGVRSIRGVILIPAEFLVTNKSLTKRLVAEKPIASKIVDSKGETSSLTHRNAGDSSEIVVRTATGITMSPSAWTARKILDQDLVIDNFLARQGLPARDGLMDSLLNVIQVITLLPPVDENQTVSEQNKTASSSARAASSPTRQNGKQVQSISDFDTELEKSNKRFVLVLGNIQKDKFVLQNTSNEIVAEKSLHAIEESIASNRSVAFLMGCGDVCTPSLYGPIELIDTLNAIDKIADDPRIRTPMGFIKAVAKTTGPIHIDRDSMGWMRAVNVPDTAISGAADEVTSPIVRIIIPQDLTHPPSYQYVFQSIVYWLIFMSIYLPIGWILVLILGMTPNRAWRRSKEIYSTVSPHSPDNLDKTESFVLFIFTPTLTFLTILFQYLASITQFIVGIFALVWGLLVNIMGAGDKKQLTGSAQKHIELLPRWANAAVPVAFIIILALIFEQPPGSNLIAPIVPEQFTELHSLLQKLIFVVGAILLCKLIPPALFLYSGFIWILGLPMLLLWGLVRILVILPLSFVTRRLS